jgi:hypothetical protein
MTSSGEKFTLLLRRASICRTRASASGARVGEEAGGGRRLRCRVGCGLRARALGEFRETVGGDTNGRAGAVEGDAMAARGAAVDEDVDVGEKAGGFVEQVGGRHGTEGIGEGEDLTDNVLVLLERGAAAGQRAVGGAEVLAAFRDAAAFTAFGIEVDAFFDHDEFPPSNKKGSPWRALHGEIPLLL